jgi:hypothetical protein
MNHKKGGDDSRPLSHILSEVTMSGGMKILPEFPLAQGTIIKEMTKGWEQNAPGLLYIPTQPVPQKRRR